MAYPQWFPHSRLCLLCLVLSFLLEYAARKSLLPLPPISLSFSLGKVTSGPFRTCYFPLENVFESGSMNEKNPVVIRVSVSWNECYATALLLVTYSCWVRSAIKKVSLKRRRTSTQHPLNFWKLEIDGLIAHLTNL